MGNIFRDAQLAHWEYPTRQTDSIHVDRCQARPYCSCCSPTDFCASSQSTQKQRENKCDDGEKIVMKISIRSTPHLIAIICPTRVRRYGIILMQHIVSIVSGSSWKCHKSPAKFHEACLLIEWKIANINFAGWLKNCRRIPQYFASVRQNSFC